MELSWTNDLSVGNRVVDYAHKEVLGMINRIAHLIAERDVVVLSEAFQLLEKSLCAYFFVEENIAQALNFDFTQHRRTHQSLLSEFGRIKDDLMAKNGKWSKREEKYYADSLEYCLIRHIKEDGKPLKVVLDTHFYDFKPSCMEAIHGLHGCA